MKIISPPRYHTLFEAKSDPLISMDKVLLIFTDGKLFLNYSRENMLKT